MYLNNTHLLKSRKTADQEGTRSLQQGKLIAFWTVLAQIKTLNWYFNIAVVHCCAS
jgi:hypothetical protein